MTDRAVRDIIRRRNIVQTNPATSVRDAARAMDEHRCGSILICDEGRLAGIFTERDLLTRVVAPGRDPEATTLNEVMTPNPDTIEAGELIQDAIRKMDEGAFRHLPVMDDGKVMGVISIRDLPLADVVDLQPELEARHTLPECLW